MTNNNIIPTNIAHQQKLHAESKTLGPGQKNHYRIWQAEASPYSHKVMAFMNYKATPYKRVAANMAELDWVVNAARIMEFLEAEHTAIKTIH